MRQPGSSLAQSTPPLAPAEEIEQMKEIASDLERFVTAQAAGFDTALAELTAGRKRSHWMWFIFPQLRGLGHSPTAQFYGIGALREAQAYYAHKLLGPRLIQCTQAVLESQAPSLHAIFGSPDDLKFRSSMTLFEAAAPEQPVFGLALRRWCDGERDRRTLQLLDAADQR
jgi:uncharacterized protein (DUF1810 family)